MACARHTRRVSGSSRSPISCSRTRPRCRSGTRFSPRSMTWKTFSGGSWRHARQPSRNIGATQFTQLPPGTGIASPRPPPIGRRRAPSAPASGRFTVTGHRTEGRRVTESGDALVLGQEAPLPHGALSDGASGAAKRRAEPGEFAALPGSGFPESRDTAFSRQRHGRVPGDDGCDSRGPGQSLASRDTGGPSGADQTPEGVRLLQRRIHGRDLSGSGGRAARPAPSGTRKSTGWRRRSAHNRPRHWRRAST